MNRMILRILSLIVISILPKTAHTGELFGEDVKNFTPISTPAYNFIHFNTMKNTLVGYFPSIGEMYPTVGQLVYHRKTSKGFGWGMGFGIPYFTILLNNNTNNFQNNHIYYQIETAFFVYVPFYLKTKLSFDLITTKSAKLGAGVSTFQYFGLLKYGDLVGWQSHRKSMNYTSIDLDGYYNFGSRFFITCSIGLGLFCKYCWNGSVGIGINY